MADENLTPEGYAKEWRSFAEMDFTFGTKSTYRPKKNIKPKRLRPK
jgi:hypothetical protein